ncbi:MAG: adenylyl-sulfate kinase [Flavisolibacter sp.]
MVIQLTGLPGAGKSTLALAAKTALEKKGKAVEVIDGDVYRRTVCKNLGFSKQDRYENMRRLGSIAHSFSMQGKIAIIAAINPYEEIRQELRINYNAKTVWIHCPVEILIQRDPKGLYRRALLPEGDPEKINNLTGINDPFEIPLHPDLIINTAEMNLQEASTKMVRFIAALQQPFVSQ